MKKIFLALFLLVFCAYSQNDSDKNQSAKIWEYENTKH